VSAPVASFAAGDRVVVEGIQKARPGAQLKVVAVTLEDFDRPVSTPAAATAPAGAN